MLHMQVLSEVHYSPYQSVAFALHRMKPFLCVSQAFTGIGHHLLESPFLLG
jgi:hypothetical protein